MRQIITLISLFSLGSIALACDTSHEVIAGFTIGCPLENAKEAVASKTNEKKVGLTRTYTFDKVDFFDTADVEVDQDNIAHVILFTKNYIVNRNNIQTQKEVIKREFNNLYSTIEKRWGEFDIKDANLLLQNEEASGLTFLRDINHQVVEISYPKSDTIGWILMFTKSQSDDQFLQGVDKEVSLHLIYIDKTTLHLAKKESKEENDVPAEELKGF